MEDSSDDSVARGLWARVAMWLDGRVVQMQALVTHRSAVFGRSSQCLIWQPTATKENNGRTSGGSSTTSAPMDRTSGVVHGGRGRTLSPMRRAGARPAAQLQMAVLGRLLVPSRAVLSIFVWGTPTYARSGAMLSSFLSWSIQS